MLEQAVCEATSGRADVRGDEAAHIDFERSQGSLQLCTTTTCVPRFLLDGDLCRSGYPHAGLVSDLAIDGYLPSQDQLARSFPAVGQSSLVEQNI